MKAAVLGNFVKSSRESLGWSQEALALGANVSLRTIQRIEQGNSMSVETLAAVARAFELDTNTLVSAATMRALIPTMDRYDRATRGHHIVSMAQRAMASLLSDSSANDVIREPAFMLHRSISDWIDVFELDNQVQAEAHINECLEALHSIGGRCFIAVKPWPVGMKDQSSKEIELDTLILFVTSDDYPYIFNDPKGEYALTGTEETAKMFAELN